MYAAKSPALRKMARCGQEQTTSALISRESIKSRSRPMLTSRPTSTGKFLIHLKHLGPMC